MSDDRHILRVEDLKIYFGSGVDEVRAVDGVSFNLNRGEIVALVGESGSGKSLSALALTRITPRAALIKGGRVLFKDLDLMQCNEDELRMYRGRRISYIFQEPMSSFNPVFTIGAQIKEALYIHKREAASSEEVTALLEKVQLPPQHMHKYPHEMSGGQLQRCMIAMALASSPDILVADEPTTALDVTIQREILELIVKLCKEEQLSILMITHNFGVVSAVADRVYVLRRGVVVEEGVKEQVLYNPRDAYTKKLLGAVPQLPKKD